MSRLIFNAVLGGTTTLESTNSADTFLITVPAANGTMSVKDSSGDATFRNITLTGAVLAGAWNGSTITVPYGGTGATTLTGYVKGNGTSAMTASATIPNTDITGLGTMSTQNANSVTITGGTISGLGTPLAVASGGTGAATLTGYVKGSGTSAMTASATIPNTDITGLGTMSTQSADSVAITGGTANGLTIGASNPAAAIFTTLRFNSTLSANGSTGTSGQVLTSNGASAPTWQSVGGVGTVTSVDGSGGTTGLTLTGGPITSSGTLTLGGTLAIANGGTNITSYATGDILYASATDVLSKLAAGSNGQVLTLAAGVPSWAAGATGTVTSVGGTGTVNGLTLTGTVTSSGNLTLGGTLDLSAPPAIGGTTPASGAFTTLTTSANAIISDNSANAALRITQTGAGNALLVEDSANPDATPFVVNASGLVGAGTTTPRAPLSFAATTGTAGVPDKIRLFDDGASNLYGFGVSSGSLDIVSGTGGAVAVYTNGANERMRIDSSGNVGLGTTTPGVKLDVADGFVRLTQDYSVRWHSAGTIRGALLADSGSNIIFQTGSASTERMRLSSAGNLGIGTGSPAAKLSVVGTAYSPNITLSDAATIAWDTSTGQVATFTFVSSNRTMGAPTNLVNGAFYALAVIQNGGSNTLTWNSVFKWAAGTAPTLSTAAGAKDYFTFRSDGTNLYQQGISQAVA